MGYWLFYAGPENYLGADGVRRLGTETALWSGAPGGRKGDLAALYPRSLTKVSVEQLREMTGMTVQRAQEVKRSQIGSDIPLIWRIVSGNQGPFNAWSNGYVVEPRRTIDPPITLRELKAEPRLRKWEDLQWNFQAQGREALEIPDFAWAILEEMIEKRVGSRTP